MIILLPSFFNFFWNSCSLKLECEKLASEKVEIQRHYVMVSNIFQSIDVYLQS